MSASLTREVLQRAQLFSVPRSYDVLAVPAEAVQATVTERDELRRAVQLALTALESGDGAAAAAGLRAVLEVARRRG